MANSTLIATMEPVDMNIDTEDLALSCCPVDYQVLGASYVAMAMESSCGMSKVMNTVEIKVKDSNSVNR